jgi:cell division protein FtsI (penicillin-binding protein 3)
VIVIDEPSGVHCSWLQDVAAPVFSNMMSGALRLMDIPPDDLQNVPATTLVQANDTHEQASRVP